MYGFLLRLRRPWYARTTAAIQLVLRPPHGRTATAVTLCSACRPSAFLCCKRRGACFFMSINLIYGAQALAVQLMVSPGALCGVIIFYLQGCLQGLLKMLKKVSVSSF